jgi:hypothetical protein
VNVSVFVMLVVLYCVVVLVVYGITCVLLIQVAVCV